MPGFALTHVRLSQVWQLFSNGTKSLAVQSKNGDQSPFLLDSLMFSQGAFGKRARIIDQNAIYALARAAVAPRGNDISDRFWFYAAQGQQQGPFPEAPFLNLIARNTVTADTLVWTEGMADWQRARDIPGLMSRTSGWPAAPPWRGPQTGAGGPYDADDLDDRGGRSLSIDPELWEFLGKSLLYAVGILLVVPARWLATSFYQWIVPRVRVPGRPNLAFNGEPMDIWWAFVALEC